MALNEQEEAKVRELLTAFENGKRINELAPADGDFSAMRVEVMDENGETRSMELECAMAEAGNPIAGRWWDNTKSTPTAGGWFGSLDFLRRLPRTLGLGRYLVTDDRKMRKLDPADSTRFVDGTPAALDGSMGQCMWCWSRPWYFTEIISAGRTCWAITLKPLEGYDSIKIPVGGTSWLGAAVMDRTEQKLCSLISNDARYRGGNNTVLTLTGKTKHPAADTPQATMLGMPAVSISTTNFGTYARKRGEGWEANWYVAQAAVQILFSVIMGTRNSQAGYLDEKDSDGLLQGGFGTGVTDMPDWGGYNNNYPVIPTDVGLEMGDGTGLVEYSLPPSVSSANQETPYHTFKIPVFFGLVHAGYGNLLRAVRGLTLKQEAGVKTEVYVARRLTPTFSPGSVAGMLKVAECPQSEGYARQTSTAGLCMMTTEVGGSPSTFYPDQFLSNGASQTGLRVRLAGGSSNSNEKAGVFFSNACREDTFSSEYCSSPLCFFVEDPVMD